MKPLLAAILALFAAGCVQDSPPAEAVRDHFERGISGQGKIVPLEEPGTPNLNPPVTQSASPNP